MEMDELVGLAPPPSEPIGVPTEAEWTEYEQWIGGAAPCEYRLVLATYGVGDFEHAGILTSLYHPTRDVETMDSERECAVLAMEGLESDEVPYALHPDRPGLVSLGSNDYERKFFYHTDGEPDQWPLVVLLEQEFEEYRLGLVEFLVRMFRGELDSEFLLQDDFRATELPVRFVPLEA